MTTLPRAARRLVALAAFFVASAPAVAVKLDETVLHVPVASGAGASARVAEIEVTVFRPEGAGPFPIVVLSHGSPRMASERRRAGRVTRRRSRTSPPP